VAADFIVTDVDVEFFDGPVVTHLSEHRDQVASLVQLFIECLDMGFDRVETHASVAVRVEPGLHDLAYRLADRNGGVGVPEEQAFGCEPVDMRCEALDRSTADRGRVVVHVV